MFQFFDHFLLVRDQLLKLRENLFRSLKIPFEVLPSPACQAGRRREWLWQGQREF